MSELIGKVAAVIPSSKPIVDEFPVTMRLQDFGFTADSAVLVIAVWNRIGVYTVEAGMEYCMGRRFDGYIYCKLVDGVDSATEFHGRVRFVVTNPAETRKQTVAEFGTRTMNASATDKTQKPVFPLSPPWVTQDSKIILEIMPEEAARTLDVDVSLSAIDMTSRVAK